MKKKLETKTNNKLTIRIYQFATQLLAFIYNQKPSHLIIALNENLLSTPKVYSYAHSTGKSSPPFHPLPSLGIDSLGTKEEAEKQQ